MHSWTIIDWQRMTIESCWLTIARQWAISQLAFCDVSTNTTWLRRLSGCLPVGRLQWESAIVTPMSKLVCIFRCKYSHTHTHTLAWGPPLSLSSSPLHCASASEIPVPTDSSAREVIYPPCTSKGLTCGKLCRHKPIHYQLQRARALASNAEEVSASK